MGVPLFCTPLSFLYSGRVIMAPPENLKECDYQLIVPEKVLKEMSGEFLVLAGLAWCKEPDEGNEVYYWTSRALFIANAFWEQLIEHTLGKSDGS